MQETSASYSGVGSRSGSHLSSDFSLSPRHSSIALKLFGQFTQVNSDETTDDVTMTEIASDIRCPHSFVSTQSSSPNLIPKDENGDKIARKRSNKSPTADNLVNKKISARSNPDGRYVSPADHPLESSFPSGSSVPNFASMFRYCSRDKLPFIVQVQLVQESDSTTLHPLHISRILSQIYPRDVLEIKKVDRNKILAEMCTYEAANRLVENKILLTRNLSFVPLYRILRTSSAMTRRIFLSIC